MKILCPLPTVDFDPSEDAISWKILSQAGHQITFATPTGIPSRGDERMLSGRGLGPLKGLLMANQEALEAYVSMSASREFKQPITWDSANPID